MTDENDSKSSLLRSGNPKEDLEAIDNNLRDAQLNHTNAAEELGYQRQIVKAIKPFWGTVELSQTSPPVVISGAMVILDWRDQSDLWATQSEQQFDEINVASSTASGVASNTASISGMLPGKSIVDFKQIQTILSQKDERTFVQNKLALIDKTLSEDYQTAWQYLNLPAFDPARGPLFLMRQVFDHFLDKLAPDKEITSDPNFVPDTKLKERNGVGVTRTHRVQFVANTKINDPMKRKTVLDSTTSFIDIYQDLNKAHNRHALNEEAARISVYSASRLLAEWLQVINLDE